MAVLRSFPAVVQATGWDEAFMAATDDRNALAWQVQRAVHERAGLWCSIGVATNRHRAKVASGCAKPAGVSRATRAESSRYQAHRVTPVAGERTLRTIPNSTLAGMERNTQLQVTWRG